MCQLPARLGHQRHSVPEGVLGAEDCVGHHLCGDGVVDRLVVERAVGLDMGQRGALTLSLAGDHEDLLDQVPDHMRARRHVAVEHGQVRGPTEADAVPVRGMCADRDPASRRRSNGAFQHRTPTGMRAGGEVGRRHDLQQRLVVTDALPDVGVQVDPHAAHGLTPSPGGGRAAPRCGGVQRGHAAPPLWLSRPVAPSMAARRRPVNAGTRPRVPHPSLVSLPS